MSQLSATDIEKIVDRKLGLFVEYVDDKFTALFEVLDTVLGQTSRIPVMQQDIAELKGDVRVIKFSLKQTNLNLSKLEKRVERLEVAT